MKRKNSETETIVEDEDERPSEAKKPSVDDPNLLLASVKEKLKEEQNEIAGIKEFIKICQDDETKTSIVTLYLKTSPECKEFLGLLKPDIRSQPDKMEVNWEALECILSVTSVNQVDVLLNSSGNYIVNKIIENHLKLVYSSLSVSSKDSLVKSALKLMSYMVAQGNHALREMLMTFDFSHNGFRQAASKRNPKAKPDVRTCFVRFCLAFFAFGDTSIVKKMLEEKGLGDLIMNDLYKDPVDSILVVLQTMKGKVILDANLLKKTKLLFFNSHVLSKLTMLCKNNHPEVKEAALDLVTCLTTRTDVGICFFGKNGEFSSKLLNMVLLKYLQSIRQHFLTEVSLQKLVISILGACPDLIVPFLSSLNQQMDARESESWFTNIKFITDVWKDMPSISTLKLTENTLKDIAFLVQLVIPPTVKKYQFDTALKNKSGKVMEHILRLIDVVLHRCMDLKNVLFTSSLPKDVIEMSFMEMIHSIPNVVNIITLRQNLIKNKAKKAGDNGATDKKEKTEAKLTDKEYETLSFLSMRILWLLQDLKPGILTESGFNICKLLFTDSLHSNEETTMVALDVLLREDESDTRLWLEKKLPSTNIIQLVLNTLLAYQHNQEIVNKGKQVLFRILQSVDFYEHHSNEIHLWIDSFLTLTDNADKQEVCFIFSTAVYRLLRDPYTSQQEILSILQDKATSSLSCDFTALPIVLIKTFKKFDAPAMCYDYLISSAKKLLLCQDDPSLLATVLISTCQDVIEKYKDLFGFVKPLFRSLKLHHEALDRIQLDDIESVESEDENDIIGAVNILTKLSDTKAKTEWKKILKKFISLMEHLFKETINDSSALITSKFICTLLKILYKSEAASTCKTTLKKIQQFFIEVLPKLLSNEISGKACAEAFLLFYNNHISIQETEVWREFTEQIVVECVKTLKSHEAINTAIVSAMTKLGDEETRNSSCLFIEKLMPHLSEELSVMVLESVVDCISSCGDMADTTCDVLASVIKAFSRKMIAPSNYKTIISKINLNELFRKSLKVVNESTMALCFGVYLLYPHSSILDSINENQLKDIFEHGSRPVFVDFLIVLLKSNETVCELFVRCVADKTITVKDAPIDVLCSLLVPVLKIKKTEDLTCDFYKRITDDVWDQILTKSTYKCNLTMNAITVLTLTSSFQSKEKLNVSISTLLTFLQKTSTQEEPINSNVLEYLCAFIKKVVSDDDQKLNVVKVLMKSFLSYEDNTACQKVIVENLPSFATLLNGAGYKTKHIEKQWKPFVVNILKKHYTDAECVNALRSLTEKLYTLSGGFGDAAGVLMKDIHNMMVGHSKFLQVFIDEERKMIPVKDSMCGFMKIMTENCTEVCNSAFVPILLMAYNGTLSKQDQDIFAMLKVYEMNGCLNQFPTSWGQQAIEIYKAKKSEPSYSTLNDISSFQILSNLEGKRVFKTAINFPTLLKMQENDVTLDEDDEMYDPRFLLLLFSSIIRPGNVVDCRHFVDSGCLSVAIAALSSQDINLRKIAYVVLVQFQEFLDSAKFREKTQVDYLMMLLKNSIYKEFMVIPAVWSVFIVRYISLLMHPDQNLYSTLNQQLLRNPLMYFKELPLFMHFFHGNSTDHYFERAWIIKLLASGLKDYTGYYMYKSAQVFELVFTSFGSMACDGKVKKNVMDLVTNACMIPVAAFDLIQTHGLLPWLHLQLVGATKEHLEKIISLLHTVVKTFKNNEKPGKRSMPECFPNETLIVAVECLNEHESLSRDALYQLCGVISWIFNTTDEFGSLVFRMRLEDKARLLKATQDLIFNHESNKSHDILSMFKEILRKLVESGDVAVLLDTLCWTKIRDQGNDIVDTFLELLKYRAIREDDNLNMLTDIIRITS